MNGKKDTSPWSGAHVRLKRLYDERVPEGMTQKDVGLKFGIGSQSMVAQYLNGIRPLNYEAAAKFAKALRCTIYDISPEMAESLQLEILPFLGKAMRRAAILAALAVLPALSPQLADAMVLVGNYCPPTVYYVKWLIRLSHAAARLVRYLTTSRIFHRLANQRWRFSETFA